MTIIIIIIIINNNSNNNKLEYDELDDDGHFFRFGPKILWANLVQKNPNCLIKMKFATQITFSNSSSSNNSINFLLWI